MTELDFQFRALEARDDRKNFYCGVVELDRFFQQYAGQNQFRHHIGTTYVLVNNNTIAGFVTISAGEMSAEKLPVDMRSRLPDYPLPIMRIARLAIDKQFTGLGLGKKLLRSSFKLALEMKFRYGCVGVVVDAKQESLVFYQRMGFISLETVTGELGDRPQPLPLFLAIKAIEQSISTK
jgi:GNAT superfamily N-acetyltransferase